MLYEVGHNNGWPVYMRLSYVRMHECVCIYLRMYFRGVRAAVLACMYVCMWTCVCVATELCIGVFLLAGMEVCVHVCVYK